jgi:hypothetical protein
VKLTKIINVISIILIIVLGYCTTALACLPTIIIVKTNQAVCNTTASCNFISTITNGGTTPIYQWFKNNSNLGLSNSSISLSGLVTGDSVWCVLTSNDPCATTTVITSNKIRMNFQGPLPSAIVTSNPVTGAICKGTVTTFSVSPTNGGSAPTYSWKKNGFSVGNFATYSTNSLVNGDSVWVVITSNDPCVVSNTASSNKIYVVLTSISASAGLDKSLCLGNYTTIGVPPSPGFVYKWKPATALSYDYVSNPRTTATTTTTYTLTVTNQAGTCSKNDTVIITVNPLPIVNLGNDTTICFGKTLLLNGGAGFVSYWWNTSTSNQYYTVIAPYTYSVTVTDANSCSSTDSITVNFDVCAGIQNDEQNNLVQVFPNPTSNILNIKSSNFLDSNIELFNMLGIKQNFEWQSTSPNVTTLNIEKIPKGIYLLKLNALNSVPNFIRIIKE